MAVLTRDQPACRKKILHACLAVSLLLFSGGRDLVAQGSSKEYQVKAAFLYNFFQFVKWPPESFPQAQAPLVIGIIGEDPFGGSLEQIVRGEKVNNHPMVIQHYHQPSDIKVCHVLFVSQSENKRVKEVLAEMKSRNILTVSDIDGFVRDGGIIRFVTENNKIRFQINAEAARAAHLTISSKLLQAAERN